MDRRPICFVGTVLLAAALAACDDPIAPRWDGAPCRNPAPLHGQYDASTPEYLVLFHSAVSGHEETSRLERKFDFTATHVFESGFSALLSSSTMHAVRCEKSVALVEHNRVFPLPVSAEASP